MLERMFTKQIADLKEDHRAAREESREDHREVKESIAEVDRKVDALGKDVKRLEVAEGTSSRLWRIGERVLLVGVAVVGLGLTVVGALKLI